MIETIYVTRVEPDLSLDEAIAFVEAHHGVSPDRLDSAWLSTPFERRAAAAERAASGIRPRRPRRPPSAEILAFDDIADAYPDLTMWTLHFGRIESRRRDTQSFMFEVSFRVVGRFVAVARLPANGFLRWAERTHATVLPAPGFSAAVALAAHAVGKERTDVHGAWYHSPKDASRETGRWKGVPHWNFHFAMVTGESRVPGGSEVQPFISPTAWASVLEDGRVETGPSGR
ncbi:MAG: hypothetical protein H6834_12615 [Planctomycetes bacterium]|nr:hypothetical protein [Planctomycetota bacterium]